MSKDKLVIEQSRNREWLWRIYWYLAEEQELGACVGEGDPEYWMSDNAPSNREEWEYWASAKAIHSLGAERDNEGFFFDSRSAANAALKVAKEALKQDRPLPEWAQKALAEGWKPPKGWKA